MTIFGLFIFVIILTVGGIAVDIMRYEYKRVTLQNTADRAVLAAGSLRQPNDPEEVVREYFRREGLEQYVTGVNVEEGLNFRRVNVQTSDTSPTMFMKFLGINELTMTPVSASEERYSEVEVSLVLDISGSMNENQKIQNLRVAGQEFIDTLFENSEPGQVSVSVIPYAAQVNLGPVFSSHLSLSPRLTQSQCVNFDPSDYGTTQLDPDATLVAAGHFDPWNTFERPRDITCPSQTGSQVVVFSDDPDFLRNQINNLTAFGGTSIEVGVKWGAALLDPSMRPVIDNMIAANQVSNEFAGRPLAYNDEDALKVLVIMTDGENFRERRMNPNYTSGLTNIYRNNSDGNISIYHGSKSGSSKYYVPHRTHLRAEDRWQQNPWGGWNNVQRLTWDQVWERFTVWWVATYFYAVPLNPTVSYRDSIFNSLVSDVQPWTKNAHLRTICDTVNARNIPIFTVAFEPETDSARAAMQMCATSQSHYFDVEGTDIRGAFRAIAGTINRLRLTQ